MTESRVIPPRMDEPSGGVKIAPSRTMSRFWPLPSLRLPLTSSAMPSEYPSAIASILISCELA
jgi:hypothetical protein